MPSEKRVEGWRDERTPIVVAHLDDRALAAADFDYAFDEFKPISVKLLNDDTSRTNRTAFHWSDVGGMETIRRELVQTVQWRFEVTRRSRLARQCLV